MECNKSQNIFLLQSCMALPLQNEPKLSYVGQLRRLSTFSPVQSSYELPLGKPSSDQKEGVHFF